MIEAAQKEPSRFAELYELHFERVYAYIARRVRERSAAEELTSHVFHQALANIGKFKWRGAPFASWLFRIAANSIADRAQRLLRESPRESSYQPPTDQGYGDRTAWVKDAWGNIWYLAAPIQG